PTGSPLGRLRRRGVLLGPLVGELVSSRLVDLFVESTPRLQRGAIEVGDQSLGFSPRETEVLLRSEPGLHLPFEIGYGLGLVPDAEHDPVGLRIPVGLVVPQSVQLASGSGRPSLRSLGARLRAPLEPA